MERLDKKRTSEEKHEAAVDHERLNIGASLFVRLWAYDGPGKHLIGLVLEKGSDISALISNLINDGNGQIVGQHQEGVRAHFSQPLQALVTAKALQQRLLMLHRQAEPQHVVAAILISAEKSDAAAVHDGIDVVASVQMMLSGSRAAQILVAEQIRELAQSETGFQFSPKPVRATGDGGSEAVYELLWTDESTYGHLREAGGSTGIRTAGRYEIQEELGHGAMGVVYKAHDQLIGRTVALKTISIAHNAPHRRELIERLKREAKAAGGLDHPNIITIFDVGQEDDRVYLSMQFLEGKTLQALLEEGRLPSLPDLISYAEQICSAVHYAHGRGVIHRDLKPANLMLTSQGVIKVLDFGIAKIEDATLTQTGMVVGTPTHMAPEQVADKKIDHRTDIFALGSVFYELFTREKPFRGDITSILYKIVHEDPLPPSIINPALPGGIDAIIRKALAKGTADRYQSCAEMGQAFREQAALLKSAMPREADGAVSAPVPTARPLLAGASHLQEKPGRPQKRKSLPLIATLLLAIGGIAGWAFYVKAHTGSIPPMMAKAVTAVRRALERHKANGPGAGSNSSTHEIPGGSQKAQNISGKDAADNKSADTTAVGIVSPNPGEAVVQQSTAPSTAVQTTPGTQPANAAAQANKAPPDADAPRADADSPAASDVGKTAAKQGDAKATSQQAVAQTSNHLPQNQKNQPATQTGASVRVEEQDSAKTSAASADKQNPPATQPEMRSATQRSAVKQPTFKVDGFSRRDIPELLRQADAAAERGDYPQARYEYGLILRLEPNNAAARSGLRRAQAAERYGAKQ